MKKITIVILLMLVPATAYLQWEMSNIYRDANHYFQAILNQDTEELMSYLHPQFTESEFAEEVLSEYFSSLSNPGNGLQFSAINFVSASDIVEQNNLIYRAVFFNFTMQVNLTDQDESGSDFWLEMLGLQYGEKNVRYDEKVNRITVQGADGMYAFKTDTEDHWKFINAQALYFMEDIIPEVVVNTFAVPLAEWRVSNL